MLDKHKISSQQLFVFITTAQIGIGILALPPILAEIAGKDAWISIILAGIITSVALFGIIRLLERYKDKSIFEINRLLYGKYIGITLNIFIAIYCFGAGALGIRIFNDVMKASTLKLTPATLLSFFIMIPSIYLTWYGLKAICRFASALIFVFSIVIVFFLILHNELRITFLMPVGGHGLGPITKAILPAVFGFLGIELVGIIYPNIADKENALKYALAANLFSMVFFAIVIAFSIGFYGEVMLKRLEFPLFSIARSYRAPVFERIDLFFVALWFPAMASSLRKYFFSSYYGFNLIFNIEKTGLFLMIFYIASVLASRIPKDLTVTNQFLAILNYIGIGLMVFYCISYFFSFINRRGVEK